MREINFPISRRTPAKAAGNNREALKERKLPQKRGKSARLLRSISRISFLGALPLAINGGIIRDTYEGQNYFRSPCIFLLTVTANRVTRGHQARRYEMFYGIKNKATGEQFGGFSADGSVIWTSDAAKAWRATFLAAKTQAALLICNGHPAQRRPV